MQNRIEILSQTRPCSSLATTKKYSVCLFVRRPRCKATSCSRSDLSVADGGGGNHFAGRIQGSPGMTSVKIGKRFEVVAVGFGAIASVTA